MKRIRQTARKVVRQAIHRGRLSRIGLITSLGLLLAVVVPLLLWGFAYPGVAIWPGMIGNYTATFIALLVALGWDRQQRMDARKHDEEVRANELEQAASEDLQHRRTEARRRFAMIADELGTNLVSVEHVRKTFEEQKGRCDTIVLLLPQLLTGAWEAGREPLGRIVADYALMAKLAFVYGRISELQWRLRFRLEKDALRIHLDNITAPLADELSGEITELLKRVRQQIDEEPTVQPLGLLFRKAMSGAIAPEGTLTLEKS